MESTRLYRAVSPDEFEDLSIARAFRSVPGSLEGKWFAESQRDAEAWGRMLFGTIPFRVVSTTVSSTIAAGFFRLEWLDNIGPARFADIEQLSSLYEHRHGLGLRMGQN